MYTKPPPPHPNKACPGYFGAWPAGAPVPRSSKRVYSLVRGVFSSERIQELGEKLEAGVHENAARFAPGTLRVSASTLPTRWVDLEY